MGYLAQADINNTEKIEAAETARIRQSAEINSLDTITSTISSALSQVLVYYAIVLFFMYRLIYDLTRLFVN